MSPQFWLGLQMDYDLDVTADMMASRLEREVRPRAVPAWGGAVAGNRRGTNETRRLFLAGWLAACVHQRLCANSL
jgi:hypothetical protein